MSKNNYTCGIDIGTQTIRLAVLGFDKSKNTQTVLTTSSCPTDGMRLGYINNTDLVAKSIKQVVTQAEKTLGFKIRKAFVSIGGINLGSVISTGSVIISKADQEITDLDINKAISDSEDNLHLLNKKIIHTIPLSYKLDGKDIHGRPEGMRGVKLEVKTLFVICLKQNIEDIITSCALANLEVEDIVASPLATSKTILTTKQKTAGCALVNIGTETVSMAVFENNLLISLNVFPIGSMDITKDIALGFKISLEEAESIKLGSVIGGDYSKKKIDEIIEARLGDIFELIENQLKRLKRSELLPAGIVYSGGGSHIQRIEELTKLGLKLPTRMGPIDGTINNKYKIKDASWYGAIGLAIMVNEGKDYAGNNLGENVKQVKGFFKSILSQLLP